MSLDSSLHHFLFRAMRCEVSPDIVPHTVLQHLSRAGTPYHPKAAAVFEERNMDVKPSSLHASSATAGVLLKAVRRTQRQGTVKKAVVVARSQADRREGSWSSARGACGGGYTRHHRYLLCRSLGIVPGGPSRPSPLGGPTTWTAGRLS